MMKIRSILRVNKVRENRIDKKAKRNNVQRAEGPNLSSANFLVRHLVLILFQCSVK